ncbi:MAG: TIGR03905 family TSCPD domain-containing protein [Clostridia bacterium]|nr:TIGR03905 family TSCPD domain-containing protein [Clostridia bacterium]
MKYSYRTQGTCSQKIDFEIEDGKLHNVVFTAGCNGNLKAIGRLVEGKDAAEIAKLLRGNTCGFKSTSCADQLSRAIEKALAE